MATFTHRLAVIGNHGIFTSKKIIGGKHLTHNACISAEKYTAEGFNCVLVKEADFHSLKKALNAVSDNVITQLVGAKASKIKYRVYSQDIIADVTHYIWSGVSPQESGWKA